MSISPTTLLRSHAWKLIAVATAFALVSAFTLSAAQASGDAYGDGTSADPGIDGSASDAQGAPDGTYVQVGTGGHGGGTLTVNFSNNVAFNGAGTDVRVHTVADGAAASATISLSDDGSTFVSAGTFADTADANIDLQALGLEFATHVRVTYSSGEFPGYNLDAVEALHVLGENTILDASLETDENPGHTEHTVTAEVTDDAVAIEGVTVRFKVLAGPNAGETATAGTNASGEATFTYTGDGGTGTDVINAWLDIDGDGEIDALEPTDQVTKEWHGVTGTIELEDVDGGGLVVGDVVLVTVEDHDLDTTGAPDTVNVTVTSTTDAAGFTLLLTETGNSTGVFVGAIELGETTDAPTQVLAAEDGDTITGTYDDTLDGNGDNPVPVIDTLTVEATEDDENGETVTVCHMPPGNPGNARTLTVGASAEAAHLAHGDTLGECDEETLPPTRQEQQQAEFCERKPNHQRCASIEILGTSAVTETDDDEDKDDERSSRGAGISKAQAQLHAFCERKGDDHPRCEGLDED